MNLVVFDAIGGSQGFENVPLVQPDDVTQPGSHFAEWMPYQIKKPTGSESGEKAAGTQVV